ncbi:hypothetical protein Bcav_1648 [Beutenbergia cavernae DSM 12333]|uniref:DUF3592 domain-containing protein n=1 Tax=Beutenbergia cavernae (strain ATCC BAA-8 / DSM 12333 / CCUG 43141 / JCM 11478 / NBRC 16432 / NCIMB 13614 / HKI 0122) TaxID=471853 RepID=C5C3Z1_BEUC1|nr:DUF3592 domain-containing protein [Beutenbergia cavernae]ACQ79904.1 hypothetical protein Bcav_1648 [Beutenbergia cavernae DSM 12333]
MPIVSVVLLGLAVVEAAIGATFLLRAQGRRTGWRRVGAVVRSTQVAPSSEGTTYNARVAYRDSSGAEHEADVGGQHTVGDTVEILVHPVQPEQTTTHAQLRTQRLLGITMLSSAVAVAILVVVLAM